MCGIVGSLSRQQRNLEELKKEIMVMSAKIAHRGPDACGHWVSTQGNVALGHQRLSIVDTSIAGAQPMRSPNGRYATVYNGEIYNHSEIRKELDRLGNNPWKGHSDTEVMLAAIEYWGLEAALNRFIGMFAMAVWDDKDRILYLVRDRFGEKPLYYGWVESKLVFASELKAFRSVQGWKEELCQNQLAQYLRYNYVPGCKSIYKNIFRVPPGSIVSFNLDVIFPHCQPTTKSYWSFSNVIHGSAERKTDRGLEECTTELDALLKNAIGLQMQADVPLGAFLSGGVDSSTVTAIMQSLSSRPIQTFSIGFQEKKYDEARFSSRVASYLGTEHTELIVTPQAALEAIPMMATVYDEPFADASQLPTYLVSRLARQKVKVSLSGDGADEMFGGYNRYVAGAAMWGKLTKIPRAARYMLAKCAGVVPTAFVDRSLEVFFEKLFPQFAVRMPGYKWQKLTNALLAANAEEFYERLLTKWPDAYEVVLGSNAAAGFSNNFLALKGSKDFSEFMMQLDAMSYLPDDILVKLDRAAMSMGLETRAPFLDHRIVEYAWRLPVSYKIRRGKGKHILRQVLYKYVPKNLIERPKAGFSMPLDSWLVGPLREWTEQMLSVHKLNSHGYFNMETVRTMWKEHLEGKKNWQDRLWSVLMFQAWYNGVAS